MLLHNDSGGGYLKYDGVLELCNFAKFSSFTPPYVSVAYDIRAVIFYIQPNRTLSVEEL